MANLGRIRDNNGWLADNVVFDQLAIVRAIREVGSLGGLPFVVTTEGAHINKAWFEGRA